VSGQVEAIFVAAERGELPAPVDRVRALAGRGLEGNRYYWEDGDAPPGRGITLIAAEAMDAVAQEGDVSIEPAATRRNVLTRGIDVNELVGNLFRIGDDECEGVELCEP
jgi:MOSC domain-containing protein YiiM